MRFIATFASLAGITSATILGLGAAVDVDANVSVVPVAQVDAGVHVFADGLLAAKKANAGYTCPHSMSYCPWTKSCSCPPGQKLDLKSTTCVGEVIKGVWPITDVNVFGSVNVEMAPFCASSPTHIEPYHQNRTCCQADLGNVIFWAPAIIEPEVHAGLEIDLSANISADLRNVCGALAGLYLESIIDAYAAFSTSSGYAVVEADIKLSLGAVLNIVNKLTCRLGLRDCHFDCVAYCTKGCPNYIDVGELGGRITGLVGFCILPKVILVVNSLKVVVNVVIDSLLCLVGGIVKTVLSTFDCHCK